MNLNDEEEDLFFTQHCLELAKLLRTEQTEDFLHLYDSLPAEWNGLRLEAAKESIRELQELNEDEFQLRYQSAFKTKNQSINMSNLPPKQSTINRNNDNDIEQTISSSTSRITSLALLQQKQHNERINANNLACDEEHNLSSKHSSSIKRNNDEMNTKTRRLQPITNNNYRTHTPVDSFVQLNLKPSSIDIKLEDYKKARDSMSATQNSTINNRPSIPQSIDTNETNQQNIIISNKKHHITTTATRNKSHKDASFDYFSKNLTEDDDDDEEDEDEDDGDDRQHSRSSSSSSSMNNKNDLLINQTLSQSNSYERSKLIPNNDFDSHGSSIATKSSSENSGDPRTGSGSDSDDEHHHHHHHHQSTKLQNLSTIKPISLNFGDNTPTIVLNKTSDNRTSQHDRLSVLPELNSYELVKMPSNDERPLLSQVPRFKQPATDDLNGYNHSNNDISSYNTQRSQQNSLSSSSHQNRNPEHHEQYNTNHSNSSRKSQTRSTKKRKNLQQQDIIRTESIPGHRGDRDVDELVMFIDGDSSSKQQQQRQRQNSAPLRPTDTNSNTTTITTTTSRRKSRKSTKNLQEINNENKTSHIDEDTHSISFIDDDDHTTTTTTTTTHSLNNDQISLPNDIDDDDDDDESHSNITNGDILLPEWHSTSPPITDDIDSLSLSSTTLNNSNSEITSEPFVTVTHRRRSIKERRQDNNNNNNNTHTTTTTTTTTTTNRITRLPSSSNVNDKRRFQNGTTRSTIQNSLSNIKPFVSTTTKEENINVTSPPPVPPLSSSSTIPTSQPSVLLSTSISNNIPEQSSPRLSSHSSSSSLSSLLKRQSKAPPVVFLNKSIDVELNDVSFGFDVENVTTSDKPTTPQPPPPVEPELEPEPEPESSIEKEEENLSSNNSKSSTSSRRSYPQRNSRGPLFYSGPDIRPNHHRNYPSQTPYIDPLVLLQYNQQRYQQYAYMNLLRSSYLPSQTPYVFIPTSTYDSTNQDEKSESIQEPLLVYATIPNQTGSVYYPPTTKKSFPSQYFYPTHPAYFQPISSSSSLVIDNKSQQDGTDNDEEIEENNNYNKSTKLFHQTKQQSASSHIMSNALQLVYSQEKRNAQTDRFNLDQLTAYLAMKWTDTIDHYQKGDDGILLTSEQ